MAIQCRLVKTICLEWPLPKLSVSDLVNASEQSLPKRGGTFALPRLGNLAERFRDHREQRVGGVDSLTMTLISDLKQDVFLYAYTERYVV